MDFWRSARSRWFGASRDPKAFSSGAYKELTEKGYRLILVNPKADSRRWATAAIRACATCPNRSAPR